MCVLVDSLLQRILALTHPFSIFPESVLRKVVPVLDTLWRVNKVSDRSRCGAQIGQPPVAAAVIEEEKVSWANYRCDRPHRFDVLSVRLRKQLGRAVDCRQLDERYKGVDEVIIAVPVQTLAV